MSKTTDGNHSLKIGWVSTYNTHCGIAAYSKYLIDAFKYPVTILAANTNDLVSAEDSNVVRCWNAGYDSFENLAEYILNYNLDCIVIQYHYGLFDSQSLNRLINRLITNNKKVIFVLPIADIR